MTTQRFTSLTRVSDNRRYNSTVAWCLLLAAALASLIVPPRVTMQSGQARAVHDKDHDSDANLARPTGVFEGEYVPGEVLVAFRPGANASSVELRNSMRASLINDLHEIRLQHWQLPPGMDVTRAVEILSANPNIRYAEPNYIVNSCQLPSSPDDALRSDLWGMHNLGQSGGTANADINAPEAWQVTNGSENIVVGVIDTGIDYNHLDLQNNIWTNQGEIGLDGNGMEKATNGVDDDGNGYIDDIRGWDFVNNDNDPMDDNGHGTHVSGTIGAQGNNSVGVVGVNWDVRLMPLKFLNAGGSGTTANAVSAILYAAKFKEGGVNVVRVTNNSWSGGKKSTALQDAIANSGSLFVAAAGNGGSSQIAYPAGYSNANIISVAATDHNDNLASFSNYSSNWVDLAAPGVNVLSTYRGNQYRFFNGTSMAAPHVVGVVALIMGVEPGLTNAAVKARILNTVDARSALAGKMVTGGRLNAGRALQSPFVLTDNCNTAQCSPANVTDLTLDGSATTPTSVTLLWTASGDDGVTGPAYLYDVRYSTSPIDANNFAQATAANGEPVPKSAGSPESYIVDGLKQDTTYYFGLRVLDEVGNSSAIATVSGKTAVAPWSVIVVEDSANDVGTYKSLAYDKSAAPRPTLAYSDANANSVKLASWDGNGWNIQTVDANSGGVRPGISLAYDQLNNPSLTYGWGKLFFAQFVPSSQSWQVTVVENKNAFNEVTSLVYAPDGNPSASYRTFSNSGSNFVKFARRTSSGWTTHSVAVAAARYNSLAYDNAGNPSIAYSDDANDDGSLDTLRLARWNGSTWIVQTVETGVVGYGVAASLAFDSSGNPGIVHAVGNSVRFLHWNGTSWDPAEIVGTGTNCSLAFNASDGSFYVSYSDETNLKISRRDDAGWTTEFVDIGVGVRFLTSIVISPCGTASIGYSTRFNNDLRLASKCPLPGP